MEPEAEWNSRTQPGARTSLLSSNLSGPCHLLHCHSSLLPQRRREINLMRCCIETAKMLSQGCTRQLSMLVRLPGCGDSQRERHSGWQGAARNHDKLVQSISWLIANKPPRMRTQVLKALVRGFTFGQRRQNLHSPPTVGPRFRPWRWELNDETETAQVFCSCIWLVVILNDGSKLFADIKTCVHKVLEAWLFKFQLSLQTETGAMVERLNPFRPEPIHDYRLLKR